MKYYKKTDIIIIMCILAVSLAGWTVYRYFFSGQSLNAEIYYQSKLVKTVSLDQKKEEIFCIPQDKHVVFHLYQDGKIAFEKSHCPDQVCVHAGKLDTAGQFAACLPNEIVMKIVPGGERSKEDLDLVIGN